MTATTTTTPAVAPQYAPVVAPETLRPGTYVYFRCNGKGEASLVAILPRGPLGQFYVTFVDGAGVPLRDGRAAVAPYSELFERV